MTFYCCHVVILYCTSKQRLKHLSKVHVCFSKTRHPHSTTGLHYACLHCSVAGLYCKVNGASAIRTSGFCLAVVFVRHVRKIAKSG
jgi:hypothetical protein